MSPVATDTTDTDNLTSVVGMPGRLGHEMTAATPESGPGSVGDTAFKDAVIIVACAWLLLIFLAYSLRHHNI